MAEKRVRYKLPGNVLDAALARIRWVFEEFDGDVTVNNSGGKDSTVTLELAAQVAAERGELPLRVQWLDQECEYGATVEYQRELMERSDIDFRWWQVPFRIFNTTNHSDPWLRAWGPDEPMWTRDRERGAVHDKPFEQDRFTEVLAGMNRHAGGAILSGMRSEESPVRRATLTGTPVYKHITWSSKGFDNEGSYTFCPIYDWYYIDVWKAIEEHGWSYNTMYDVMAKHGVPINSMRVSNYHHETSYAVLRYLQEAEPDTWEAATRRLDGINVYGRNKSEDWMPDQLPYMFRSWEEYAIYLIDTLVTDTEGQERFLKLKRQVDTTLPTTPSHIKHRELARAVITNDQYGTTTHNWLNQYTYKLKKAGAQP